MLLKPSMLVCTEYPKVCIKRMDSDLLLCRSDDSAGTVLPPDLVCLHEYKDHHSLQCSRPMPLATLNKLLTRFCKEHGEYMTKNEFIDRYDF